MSTDSVSTTRTFARKLALHGEDWLLLAMLAGIFAFALAGAFTHMHDWTITATNEALRAYAERRGVEPAAAPDWTGWANAVTSEIMPTAALLYIRKRQRQGRAIAGPVWLYVGSMAVSLLGQLSSVGVRVGGDALFLACLPVFALTVLSVLKFADMSYAREHAEAAELAAEQARADAELKAEQAAARSRRDAQQAAEHAAELKRQEAEHAAELEARRLAAELEAAERRARIETAAITERAQIEAAERQAEREAAERREAREAEARRAVQVEKARVEAEAAAELVRAQAAVIEAEAEAKRQAAARLAALTAERSTAATAGGSGIPAAGRQRRPQAETAEAVQAVLALLPAGTQRAEAVAAVAEQLSVSAEYARRFVPADFVAGEGVARSSASSVDADGEVPHRRHLALASSGLGSAS